MATRDENEKALERVVASGLRNWLGKARDAVMAPFRQYKMQPDPTGIYRTQPAWNEEIGTILTSLGRIAEGAWNEVKGAPAVSRHAFVMSQLAQTQNFLARIPDETYHLVFAEITDAINGGANIDQVAAKVDDALNFDGAENWPARARTIAQTEVNRAMNAGVAGAGAEMSRVTGQILNKQWRAHRDEKTRIAHHAADGQTVPFYQPFMVGGEPLQFPGDPAGSPENVINCRCSVVMKGEGNG